MKRTIWLIFLLLTAWQLTAGADRIEIFRSRNWQWSELENLCLSPEVSRKLTCLKQKLDLNEAHRVCGWLADLEHPGKLAEMAKFPAWQRRLGGGFYGMIPENDEELKALPVPRGIGGIISAAAELARIRNSNIRAIRRAQPGYPAGFTNLPADFSREAFKKNRGMAVNLNLKPLQQLLAAFELREFSKSRALALARRPEFSQMLQHRRDLGYVPEPLPDAESLAEFMVMAGSRQPLRQLWKWVSPCNLFNMSDLYEMRHDYAKLLKTLDENRDKIEQMMLSRYHDLGIHTLCFTESIDFAVNWGIRSWATERSLGTNITMFKDNFPAMFRTLIHETFHRLQLRICPGRNPKNRRRNFEDLVVTDTGNREEQKFYEVLAYIFLEGTATYAGGAGTAWNWKSGLKQSGVLLDNIRRELFLQHRFEQVDKLLNKGLKSNGPFYALGYYMCSRIAEKHGTAVIRRLLQQGSVAFFNCFLELEPDTDLLSPELKQKICRDMKKIFNPGGDFKENNR